MKIWALADLHLPFGAPEKSMEAFGSPWENYTARIKENWEQVIAPTDLVLIAGDISWALKLKDAMKDLEWIGKLPGQKLMLKGNHDLWWPSSKKLKAHLPPSIHFIHNDAFTLGGVTVGGSRLWESREYSFEKWAAVEKSSCPPKEEGELLRQEKIFERELQRLTLSLNQLSKSASYRIAMTHYPPIGGDLKRSKASTILDRSSIDVCVFGHLHNLKKEPPLFGKKNRTNYLLTSADYLDFHPLLLV